MNDDNWEQCKINLIELTKKIKKFSATLQLEWVSIG